MALAVPRERADAAAIRFCAPLAETHRAAASGARLAASTGGAAFRSSRDGLAAITAVRGRGRKALFWHGRLAEAGGRRYGFRVDRLGNTTSTTSPRPRGGAISVEGGNQTGKFAKILDRLGAQLHP